MKKLIVLVVAGIFFLSTLTACGTKTLTCESEVLGVKDTVVYKYTSDEVKSITVNGEKVESDEKYDVQAEDGDIESAIEMQKASLELLGFTCK